MPKSVYSIVLMDDVVAAVDRLAYASATSRSNMMNRILAEYLSMDTPEQRMQEIFSAISAVLDQGSVFQPLLSAGDAMFSLRSALQYKYNPSVKYAVELYPQADETFGELRVSLRTQNPSLLVYLAQFYRLWVKLEGACLNGPARVSEIASGRYTRRLCTPVDAQGTADLGGAIAGYVSLFDACLKAFFDGLDSPDEAISTVGQIYRQNINTSIAQL